MQIRKLWWFFIACEIHKAARDVDNNTRKYLLYVWYLRMWTHSNMLCWRWKYLYSNKRNPMAVIEAGWPGLYQWRWYWPPGWCTPRGRSPSGSSCSGTVCNIAAVRGWSQQGDSFCGGVSQVWRLECSSFDINVHRCQNWRTLELTRLGCKYDTWARDEDLRYPGDWYGHAVAGVNVDGAHRDGHRVQRQSAVQSTVQYSTVCSTPASGAGRGR